MSRSLLEARQDDLVLVIVLGSAIEPWARRAAELFSIPTLTVSVNPKTRRDREADIAVSGNRRLQRDAVAVTLSDRVDCPLVRSGGNVEAALLNRLSRGPDSRVRVAIHPTSDVKTRRCARSLMSHGAVGWYLPPPSKPTRASTSATIVANDWSRTEDQWLVHCTRARSSRMSEPQRRDAMLVGHSLAIASPMETLTQIVRRKRLVGSAIASDRRFPVVCFSARPLVSLLAERTYRSHLHRWDYEPYGIAIRKSAAVEVGLMPVIYGTEGQRDGMKPCERYRFQAIGKTYDWTREREWRKLGDVPLAQFGHNDLRVFVPSDEEASMLGESFPVSVVG
ncbi:MAG: hypothetical protein AAFU85_02390 [Planctomycetota bacterium]